VLILTHVRELIRQTERMMRVALPEHDVSVYAAGLDRREHGPITIAQLQSFYKSYHTFPAPDVAIIDENHLVGDTDSGMYRTLLAGLGTLNPRMRVVGMSATPFRMGSGLIYGPGQMFSECVYRIGMRRLMDEGWLTPLVGKVADKDIDTSQIATRGGEFVAGKLEAFMTDEGKVDRAVDDALRRCTDRQQVLIFSSGLKHSAMIQAALVARGQLAESVDGTMHSEERDAILTRFRDRGTRFLVNCAILTTGYDDPGIDAIIMLRPTRSGGLLLQCAGRGLRRDPRKQSCLFLDYGGCLGHFGPLDTIEDSVVANKGKGGGPAPTKVCPQCDSIVFAGVTVCPDCGHEFPRELKHEVEASPMEVLSTGGAMPVDNLRVHIMPQSVAVAFHRAGHEVCRVFFALLPESNAWARDKSMTQLRLLRHKRGTLLDWSKGYVCHALQPCRTVRDLATALRCLETPTSIKATKSGIYWALTAATYPEEQ